MNLKKKHGFKKEEKSTLTQQALDDITHIRFFLLLIFSLLLSISPIV